MLTIEDNSFETKTIAALKAENERLKAEVAVCEAFLRRTEHRLQKAEHDRDRYARRIRFEQKRVDAVVNENRRLIKDSNILSEVRTLFWRMFDDGK